MFEWVGEETIYPEVQFFTRLIEGNYPNYQEIIPKKFTTEIILNKEEFQNQIKKAGLFSGKISEVKIPVIPKEDRIKIFSQNPELGKNEAYQNAKIETKEKEEIEISFNYKFLLEGLINIKGNEILFNLNGKEGAAVLKSTKDDSYIYILMPIKSS
jgi:DNA polymerase-3 subunit beta